MADLTVTEYKQNIAKLLTYIAKFTSSEYKHFIGALSLMDAEWTFDVNTEDQDFIDHTLECNGLGEHTFHFRLNTVSGEIYTMRKIVDSLKFAMKGSKK